MQRGGGGKVQSGFAFKQGAVPKRDAQPFHRGGRPRAGALGRPSCQTLGVLVIKIDTSPVKYYSQLDEKSFFEWALEIPCVTSVEGGFLHVRSKRLSESDLRDLIALMSRYKMPMNQLQQFCNPKNEHWFKSEKMYWYKSIFSTK
jgi:hypothetical protein